MKLKSVTLIFMHWFSKAAFGELTVYDFRFVKSPSFFIGGFDLSPLCFGVASFFIEGL
jgi:hypothetical protein